MRGAEGYIREEREKIGRFSAGERNTLVAFAVAVTLWILPGLVALVAGDASETYETVLGRLDEGAVAVLAASLLFFLPVDWKQRKFTLTWNQAAGIDWGTIVLFGSGVALGTLLSETGLAERVGDGISSTLGVTSPVGITILAVVVAVLISETTSNTASVGIVVPIVIPIAQSAGVDPVISALAAVFGASYGFMLPVSTPPQCDRLRLGPDPDHEDGSVGSGVRRHRRRSDHHGSEHHGERRGPRLRAHASPRLSRSQRSPYTFGALLTGGKSLLGGSI